MRSTRSRRPRKTSKQARRRTFRRLHKYVFETESGSEQLSWLVPQSREKERFVKSFSTNEAIRLEKKAMRYIAVERCLTKHSFNSMWVTLTERNDRIMTKVITEP